MNRDDFVYAFLLILSIPVGNLFKKFIRDPRLKSILSSVIGLFIVVIVCKTDTLHSLFLVITNSMLILLVHSK